MTEQWQKARAYNSAATQDNDPLLPLHQISRDNLGQYVLYIPANFPATRGDFIRMRIVDMSFLAIGYNIPVIISVENRRRALAEFIGLPGI